MKRRLVIRCIRASSPDGGRKEKKLSDCTHGGRDAYAAPKFAEDYETEVGGGRVLYVPRRPKWTVTSIDMSDYVRKGDMDSLRDIYVHGARFTRVPERDWDEGTVE
ncbi:MAG: hypothetical protein IKP01_02085 [Bacteroidales bacterium]|nr:hypothetical protein [Bacteroidales bacterium]